MGNLTDSTVLNTGEAGDVINTWFCLIQAIVELLKTLARVEEIWHHVDGAFAVVERLNGVCTRLEALATLKQNLME